jgi:hypothetical protein
MFVKDSCQYLDMTNMAVFITISSFMTKNLWNTKKAVFNFLYTGKYIYVYSLYVSKM